MSEENVTQTTEDTQDNNNSTQADKKFSINTQQTEVKNVRRKCSNSNT